MGAAVLRHVTVGNLAASGAITHGSQINSVNTGPLGAVSDAPFGGTISMSQTWLDANNGGSNVIEGWRITDTGFNFGAAVASIPADSDGIHRLTIQHCDLEGIGWANGSVWFNTALSGNDVPSNFLLTLRHLRINGLGQVTSEIAETVFQGGQTNVSRCEVLNICGMTRNGYDNWSAIENYVHSLAAVPDVGASPHTGCITTLHGSNILIARNKAFTCKPDGTDNDNIGATGSIVSLARQDQGQGLGNSDNVRFIDNALQGGSYSTYGGADGPNFNTNMVATGNIFYRDTHRLSGQFGPETSFSTEGPESANIWDNNRWGPPGPWFVDGDPAEGELVGSDG